MYRLAPNRKWFEHISLFYAMGLTWCIKPCCDCNNTSEKYHGDAGSFCPVMGRECLGIV